MTDARYLVWRNGRPRWEPGPTVRALGFKGMDLKNADRSWMTRDQAVSAATLINTEVDQKRPESKSFYRVDPKGEAQRSHEKRHWHKESKPEPLESVARNRKGYVYFLWAGANLKIGFSVNPFKRLANLETSLSEPMMRVAVLQGTLADERRLHRRFHTQRSHGEWFRATAALQEIVLLMIEKGTTKID